MNDPQNKPEEKVLEDLYQFLAHGDEEHRRWLKEAIWAYFEGKPRPEVR